MDAGLFLLRAVLGALLLGHGTQKLFGWFGGHGISGTAEFFRSLGHRPPRQMAIVAGLSEAGGGALLLLGFLDPLGTAIVVGVMLVAASTHWPRLWITDNGFELPVFYAVTAASLGLTGPGAWSIDGAIGWSYGVPLALGTIIVGIFAAAVVIARAHSATTEPQPEPELSTAPIVDRELLIDRDLIGAGRR